MPGLKLPIVFFLGICCLISCRVPAEIQLSDIKSGQKELLFEDSFERGLENWIVEKEAIGISEVYARDGKMIIDVGGGATVWFKKSIANKNVLIQYNRKVIMNNGENDRLSDLNQFWMANDPEDQNLFSRSGTFAEYDSLQMYYAGIGGNRNTTTRFRKYLGNGDRKLIYDLTEKEYLLEPNKTYFIQILVLEGTTKLFIDGEELFSFKDNEPLKNGYFGFRTVQSHQEIEDFKIFSLNIKSNKL